LVPVVLLELVEVVVMVQPVSILFLIRTGVLRTLVVGDLSQVELAVSAVQRATVLVTLHTLVVLVTRQQQLLVEVVVQPETLTGRE
jgi:hypothetical protein